MLYPFALDGIVILSQGFRVAISTHILQALSTMVTNRTPVLKNAWKRWLESMHADTMWQQRGYMRLATITCNKGWKKWEKSRQITKYSDLFILVIYTLLPSCIAKVVTPHISALALHCPVSPLYIWTINRYYDDDNLFSNEHRNDTGKEHLVVLLAAYSVWQACVNHKTTWIQLHILWQVMCIT